MATANCFYPEEPSKGYHGLFISNPNVLTNNNHLDPMYGSPDLTCLLCKVYKAKDEELTEGVFHTEEYGFVPPQGHCPGYRFEKYDHNRGLRKRCFRSPFLLAAA